MFKSRSPKKEECITQMRCITFDKKAQDNLPDDIKAKMKADRDRAREEARTKSLHFMSPKSTGRYPTEDDLK